MLIPAVAISDPTDVIIWGVVIAVGLVRFIVWLIRPPRWQDLEKTGTGQYYYNKYMNWW